MKGAILITDDVHPVLISGLEELGYRVEYIPDASRTLVMEVIGQFVGLIINSRIKADTELLSKAVQLKFVARLGSGLEVIDLEFAKSKGIVAINSPEGNANAVAEHALGMLLNLMNNISKSAEEVSQMKWLREENRGEELSGKTVGLIAYGNTAKALAHLLSGFDVRVLAYDKYLKDFSNSYVREATLTEVLSQSDVISLHLPLTKETEYMVDESFFSNLTKPIWFLNTSRGKVVNTKSLLNAIEEGKLKGAGLDVLENEKLETFTEDEKGMFRKLINSGKVIITPHIAGWTHQSKQKIAEVLLQKVALL